jgi:hypothetical protein
MKIRIRTLFGLGVAGMLLGAGGMAAPAGGTSPSAVTNRVRAPKSQPAPKKRKVRGYPFRGKLGAVDKVKHTITVTTKNTRRVFPVNAKTKFIKNGKPAKLTDGVIGEEVAGYVRKLENGKLLAVTVRFGPKPKKDAAPHRARKRTKASGANPAPPKP